MKQMWLLIVFGALLPAYAVKSGDLDELIDLRNSLQRMESALNSQLARTALLEGKRFAMFYSLQSRKTSGRDIYSFHGEKLTLTLNIFRSYFGFRKRSTPLETN